MPRKSKKKPKDSYHHGDLRAALMEAAVALLREKGPSGLSLRECARRVGVSHAAPYRHFEDKDTLLLAIAIQGFGWLVEAGRAAMEGLEDPRERIVAYGLAYVRFAVDHPEHLRLMFTSELDPSKATAEEQAIADSAFELLRENAADLAGPDGDDMLTAFGFWSLSHGLSMLILDGRVPPEHIASPEAVDTLARGVFAQWRG